MVRTAVITGSTRGIGSDPFRRRDLFGAGG
jgi:hypothetical protein